MAEGTRPPVARVVVALAILAVLLSLWRALQTGAVDLSMAIVMGASILFAGWMWDDSRAAGRSPWPWMLFPLPGVLLAADLLLALVASVADLTAYLPDDGWFAPLSASAWLTLTLGVGFFLVVRELRPRHT